MRAFFTRLASIFGILFLVLVAIGFFLPNDFVVRRSVVVDATPERLYALIGDLRMWPEWGPWAAADESLAVELGPKTSGVGASQKWTGKDGDGRLVITEADPQRGVWFDLFFNQDAFVNKSAIRYVEAPGGYEVYWEMSGKVDVPILGGFLAPTMDDIVGPMFADGLEKLKAIAEAPAE